MPVAKITTLLWGGKDAKVAATFFAETLPDCSVRVVHCAPGDFLSDDPGDGLTVEFTMPGIPCLGLSRGLILPNSEAF